MQINQNAPPVSILYIEDEAASRDIMLSMLEPHLPEARVISADNGSDGLKLFRTYHPDIVITDIFMPIMNGLDMAQIMKLEDHDTIIIATSANTETAYFMKAIEIGINHFVLKPINFERIFNIIDRSVALVRLTQKYKAQSAYTNKLSLAVEQSPCTVVITDKAGFIEYVNPKFTSLTGYSMAEALGMNVRALKSEHTERAVYQDLWHTITSGREWHGEFCNQKKNGELYWESASISPLLDPQGAVTHFVAVKEDITARKQSEFEINMLNTALAQRSEKLVAANRDLEAFNYSVSHDLLTPVTVISGFAHVLLTKCLKDGDACRKYVDSIKNEANSMDSLIKALLKLSRISSQQISHGFVDLSALASAVTLEIRTRHPERRVSCTIAPGLSCAGEHDLLRIVLKNLLDNAWKFTAPREQAEVEFGTVIDGGIPVFFVRDNGVGFDGSKAGDLFNAFHRLHDYGDFKGFGIGLATVQRIIDKHGGNVWAEREIGRGACIYFTLP